MEELQKYRARVLEDFNKLEFSELEVDCGEVRLIGCCDCGLMHNYVIDIIGENRVRTRFARDDGLTKQSRQKFTSRFPLLLGE